MSASLQTDFVLDALEQAICARGGPQSAGLVHHSDRVTEVPSRCAIRTARLRYGSAPSVGTRGDSYDNALA